MYVSQAVEQFHKMVCTLESKLRRLYERETELQKTEEQIIDLLGIVIHQQLIQNDSGECWLSVGADRKRDPEADTEMLGKTGSNARAGPVVGGTMGRLRVEGTFEGMIRMQIRGKDV